MFKRQILQNNTTYQRKKIIIDYWTGLRTLLPRFPSIILLFFSQQCAGLVVGCMMISVCYWGNILTTIHLLSHLTAWDLLNLHVCRLCEEMAYPEEIDNIQIPQWKVPLTYWLKIEYLLLLKFRIFLLEASSSCHTLFSHSHLQGIKMPTPYVRQIFTINSRKRSKLHFNEIQIRRRKSVLFISPHKSYLFIFVSLCFSPFTKAKRANII